MFTSTVVLFVFASYFTYNDLKDYVSEIEDEVQEGLQQTKEQLEEEINSPMHSDNSSKRPSAVRHLESISIRDKSTSSAALQLLGSLFTILKEKCVGIFGRFQSQWQGLYEPVELLRVEPTKGAFESAAQEYYDKGGNEEEWLHLSLVEKLKYHPDEKNTWTEEALTKSITNMYSNEPVVLLESNTNRREMKGFISAVWAALEYDVHANEIKQNCYKNDDIDKQRNFEETNMITFESISKTDDSEETDETTTDVCFMWRKSFLSPPSRSDTKRESARRASEISMADAYGETNRGNAEAFCENPMNSGRARNSDYAEGRENKVEDEEKGDYTDLGTGEEQAETESSGEDESVSMTQNDETKHQAEKATEPARYEENTWNEQYSEDWVTYIDKESGGKYQRNSRTSEM